MTTYLRISTVLFFALLADVTAAEPPAPAGPPGALGFLEAGKDYVIRFPEGSDVFKTSGADVTESSYTTQDGKKHSGGPVTFNWTLSVDAFQVVRFGGGSWVLLRHPANAEVYTKWSAQRRAMAILAGPNVDAIKAKPDGKARLKRLEDAAAAKIPTAETWVNLDHAIAIAQLPTEEIDVKMTIRSIKTTPNR
jgi:hypothetical protein